MTITTPSGPYTVELSDGWECVLVAIAFLLLLGWLDRRSSS